MTFITKLTGKKSLSYLILGGALITGCVCSAFDMIPVPPEIPHGAPIEFDPNLDHVRDEVERQAGMNWNPPSPEGETLG